MIVLGIETSCDETAVALLERNEHEPRGRVLAHELFSQLDEHALYGGVVPEIAARAHLQRLDLMIETALTKAELRLEQVDLIAATAGPGLIGGLMVGLVTAKALALVTGKPLIAVNHLEAHALTVRHTHGMAFPYLLLLVSGGHSQLVMVEGIGRYRRLGSTIDDAVGEAFDKAAKMLGLPFPGGPAIERLARKGDPGAFDLPRPLLGTAVCNFSFSGLKTALRQRITALPESERHGQTVADLCAAFQAAITDCLADRCGRALAMVPAGTPLVAAGGVAANAAIRQRLEALALERCSRLVVPPPALCTDNAVMVAWAGLERHASGLVDDLETPARARWPLDPHSPPLVGSGARAKV